MGSAPGTAAVVFDVDGTLVDSERDGHRVAFNRAFEQAGLPYRWDPQEYGDLLVVAGGRQRLEHFLSAHGHAPDEAAAMARDLHGVKTEIFRAMARDGVVPLRPGVARLVEELRSKGVRLFVATTGSRAWVEPLLGRHFPGAPFELVLTGTEVADLKPDPAVYQEVLRRAGLAPADVVAVEDSANGLAAAKAAGLRCLVVTNDYTCEQDLAAADLLVDGFAAVSAATVTALA